MAHPDPSKLLGVYASMVSTLLHPSLSPGRAGAEQGPRLGSPHPFLKVPYQLPHSQGTSRSRRGECTREPPAAGGSLLGPVRAEGEAGREDQPIV